MLKQYCGALALLIAAVTAPSVCAATICEAIPAAKVQAILGSTITGKEVLKGMVSEVCSYNLTSPEGVMGMFAIERYTVTIPIGDEAAALTNNGTEETVAVPDIGDGAWMNTFSAELIARHGKDVYKLVARGVPCPKRWPDETHDQENARCDATASAILRQTATLLVTK